MRLKGRCGKCNRVNTFVKDEIPLRIDNSSGDSILLCTVCCKKLKWYTEEICKKCSEKTMCRGLFLSNMKKALKKSNGVL